MSPVSNTSARRGAGEESNLRNVAPETNAQAMSPWALVTSPKRRFSAQKRSHRDVTASSPLSFGAEKCAKGLEKRSRKSDLAPYQSRIGAWCGPGNPALGTGLPPQSCAGNRIAPAIHRIALMHYQQLWLGAVLARAQPCDGAGPAVELPGLRHIVYAQEQGQAACEERVSDARCIRRTLLSASGRCCVKEPHFPKKLLRSRTKGQAARRPARPL